MAAVLHEIGRKTKIAAIWRACGKSIGAAIDVAAGIALARLLMPEDFGVVELALVAVMLVDGVCRFCLDQAVVQRAGLTQRQTSTAMWATVVGGLIGAGTLVLLAHEIGAFFGEPESLASAVLFLSLSVILRSISAVPGALLRRDFDFRAITIIEVLARTSYAVVGLALAATGHGFMSLVYAWLGSEGAKAGLIFVFVRYAPVHGMAWSDLRALLGFGLPATGSDLLTQLTARVDVIVIGRALTASALGLYRRGLTLVTYPTRYIAKPLESVLFSSFAGLQTDHRRVEHALRRALTGVTGASFIVLGVFLVAAPELIPLVFGEQWAGAVPAAQILCLAGAAQVVGSVAAAACRGMGYVNGMIVAQSAYLAALAAGVIYASRSGITAVAWAVGVATLVHAIVLFVVCRWAFGLRGRTVLFGIRLPVVCTAATILVAAGVRGWLLGLVSPWWTLGITVVAGSVTYLSGWMLMPWREGREMAGEFWRLAAERFTRHRHASAASS